MPAPTYDGVGATMPSAKDWSAAPAGFRRHESSVVLGQGPGVWADVRDRVLRWGVKTAGGFTVDPPGAVREGTVHRVTYRFGPLRVVEPVLVVAVVDTADRAGFAYGTLPGHPVSGEEAFVVHRDAAGTVRLTLRSLTRRSTTRGWALVFPVLLLAQRAFRRRYRRALAGR